MKTQHNQLIIGTNCATSLKMLVSKNSKSEIIKTFRIAAHSVLLIAITIFNADVCKSTTYKSIANGNWTNTSIWQGNAVPPSTLPSGDSILLRHTVNYNASNNIEIGGILLIEPLSGSSASFIILTGKNFEVQSTGRLIIKNGTLIQRRFTSGNDGQPYSGVNPGAGTQSGNFNNKGGYINILNSYVEVAQNWSSESGGIRVIKNGCLYTGQNYSLTGSTSKDTLEGVTISVGWHGSGNFELSDASIYFNQTRIQIAGASGHFKLNSGSANGDIDYIALRNQIVPFTGSGNIEVSSSVNNSPSLNLDAYCAASTSNLIHNSKFSGSITRNCGLNYFPGNCNSSPLTPLNITIANFTAEKNNIIK